MTIYLSDRTGASIDQVLDDADNGSIGKTISSLSSDLNLIGVSGFNHTNGSSNTPSSFDNGEVVHLAGINSTFASQLAFDHGNDNAHFRTLNGNVWQPWQELYHTGNTGFIDFSDANPSGNQTRFALTQATIRNSRSGIGGAPHMELFNDNGQVGSISTSGTATAYNTSSDPRLKDFSAAPSDELINSEFNSLFDCFRVFNWKTDPTGDLVWGFDAHECIDKNTNIGSEGEGPRELALGDVYNTTPAVFEDQEVPLLYKSGERLGQPRFDSEGVALTETVSVEVTAEIEHKVSPAGVDQSKAVPILLAKIEQLERRLVAAGL